jgi:hypothetical protein
LFLAVSVKGWQTDPWRTGHGDAFAAIVAAGGIPPLVVLASPSASAAITAQSTQAPATSRTLGEE